MVDLKRCYRRLKPEIEQAIDAVMESTQFVLGPELNLFEQEVAAYHNVPYAIGVASGTDALFLSLKALGIKRNDEVITTTFTFIATAEAISYLGAKPVFVDILPDTFNINPYEIEKKITKKTKAIIPVHLFGHPADMDMICDLAQNYGLKVIEDCAQAFGALYRGKKVGTMGDVGCFSFFPSKNLGGMGDGGLVITRNGEVAKQIKMLRNHGSKVPYEHEIIGHNSRLDELQAAVLRVKLKRVDEFNKERRLHAESYRRYLKKEGLILPEEKEGCYHVYHQFTIRTEKRKEIMAELRKHNISYAIYYPRPVHLQQAYRSFGGERLPVSELCASEVLSLPIFPELTEEEIKYISRVVNDVL